MFNTIMVPTDGSEYSKKAEDTALALAKKLGSVVVAVHIIDDKLIYPYEVLEEEGKSILRDVQKKGNEMDVDVHEILIVGSPTNDMAKIAQKAGADLVILSTHGKTGLERLIMGSVAENAIKKISVPVMLVK
ncbi:universal stress protein [Methanobacterium formicicum]|uniref:UspA domain-containing protein n=1 Tax=Methanobacterium formicicum (strain DSM 3637 / PP1) TaxID=1204725 RepID=K2QEE9_METFP|nr:universal stress protein [Methanobacterium formicicum]EKF86466.1 UspA domain-containing protein [Methanobacterium formicicum DSM 3637]